MTMTATYSPEDNKLRLYASTLLDADTYARVKAAGFRWAPRQELFVSPMWTPEREDLLEELCGEIDDEDTSLVERAEERAGRFDEYSDSRRQDAESAHRAVSAISDGIPLGQPILVGHHSERRARKDAERIEAGMRRAVKMWDTAQYWQARAKGALRHAKYKERPDVRARRIKGIEADKRKQERYVAEAQKFTKLWSREDLTLEQAAQIANYDRGYWSFRFDFKRESGEVYHNGPCSLWDAVSRQGIPVEDVRQKALRNHAATIAHAERWIQHFDNRLAYERAMLGESGGTAADKTGPEKGGACRCWATDRGRDRWSHIVKVNKVSVTVLDNWGNGGADFTRTIPFDKLTAVMSKAEVDAARAAGRIVQETPRGFALLPEVAGAEEAPVEATAVEGEPTDRRDDPPQGAGEPVNVESVGSSIDAMRQSLKAGVQVVSAPQLFPTPPDVARQLVDLADIQPGMRVLEPSAGTGVLVDAILRMVDGVNVEAVEINCQLADRLYKLLGKSIKVADFLALTVDDIGTFDRIVMNPPFERGSDIKHIEHALTLLKPRGRLVAICAAGPRQRERFGYDEYEDHSCRWIDLPDGTFKEQGTNVRTAIVVIDKPETVDRGFEAFCQEESEL